MLTDASRAGENAERLTDPAWWTSLASGASLDGGRGGVRVTDAGPDQWVLRHYRRGGLVGRVVDDVYFWTGLERTRAFREWRLLDTLATRGLPVPTPVAARIVRRGLFYRADLVTVRIQGAVALSARLVDGAGGPTPWPAIGRTLRRFHDEGVCHADLNAHNILLDPGDRVFLLDFDRGRLRAAGGWRKDNMNRLHRSLDKIGAAAGRPLYEPGDWQTLLDAYDSA